MSTDTITAETPLSAIAEAFGEQQGRMRMRRVNWEAMLREGAIVKLHVRRDRMRRMADFTQMGVFFSSAEDRRAFEQTFKATTRWLLDATIMQQLQNVESRARVNLQNYSLQTFWGRFVPRVQYANWASRNEILKAEYYTVARDIAQNWPTYVEDAVARYRTVYRQVWNRNTDLIQNRGYATLENWLERMEALTRRELGSGERFLQSCLYDWETEYIPLTDVPILTQDVRDQLESDLIRTQATKSKRDLQTFVDDVKADIRQRVYDVARDSLTAIKANDGKLPRNSTKQLKNLIDQVERLVFWDDAQLEEQMSEIRRIVNFKADERPVAELSGVLQQMGTEARITLLELDRAPRESGRELGIPDELPDLYQARRARLEAPVETLDGLLRQSRQAREIEVVQETETPAKRGKKGG